MTVISDSDRRVGRTLSAARHTAGWSLEQLAPAIGLNSSDLAQAEAGRRRLQTVEMFKVSAALRTSVAPFMAIITGESCGVLGVEGER